jgi:NADH-quinone oxidoreductase subunit N
MVVMAVEETTGSSDISAFNGLSRRSPWLAWSMFIFLLSLTGIPLTGGFLGKFYVFGAAVQHQYYLLVIVAALNAGIAAFYYLNIVRAMFFPSVDATTDYAGSRLSIPVGLQLVLVICVVATLWLGIYPPGVLDWANQASQQLLTMQF